MLFGMNEYHIKNINKKKIKIDATFQSFNYNTLLVHQIKYN